jgi:hypothetical protein
MKIASSVARTAGAAMLALFAICGCRQAEPPAGDKTPVNAGSAPTVAPSVSDTSAIETPPASPPPTPAASPVPQAPLTGTSP